jgi:hypothetical protein
MKYFLLALAFILAPSLQCADGRSVPLEAHIAIDKPSYDENGVHNGWYMAFSAHVGKDKIRYWKKEGEPNDYRIEPGKTSATKVAISDLARHILNNDIKPINNENRLQFGFSNESGSMSGLYFYNESSELSAEIKAIVDKINQLIANG